MCVLPPVCSDLPASSCSRCEPQNRSLCSSPEMQLFTQTHLILNLCHIFSTQWTIKGAFWNFHTAFFHTKQLFNNGYTYKQQQFPYTHQFLGGINVIQYSAVLHGAFNCTCPERFGNWSQRNHALWTAFGQHVTFDQLPAGLSHVWAVIDHKGRLVWNWEHPHPGPAAQRL